MNFMKFIILERFKGNWRYTLRTEGFGLEPGVLERTTNSDIHVPTAFRKLISLGLLHDLCQSAPCKPTQHISAAVVNGAAPQAYPHTPLVM